MDSIKGCSTMYNVCKKVFFFCLFAGVTQAQAWVVQTTIDNPTYTSRDIVIGGVPTGASHATTQLHHKATTFELGANAKPLTISLVLSPCCIEKRFFLLPKGWWVKVESAGVTSYLCALSSNVFLPPKLHLQVGSVQADSFTYQFSNPDHYCPDELRKAKHSPQGVHTYWRSLSFNALSGDVIDGR